MYGKKVKLRLLFLSFIFLIVVLSIFLILKSDLTIIIMKTISSIFLMQELKENQLVQTMQMEVQTQKNLMTLS